MSQIEGALVRIRAKALQIGIPVMAERAGIDERTVRRMLKKNPVQIENLKKLEAVADDAAA